MKDSGGGERLLQLPDAFTVARKGSDRGRQQNMTLLKLAVQTWVAWLECAGSIPWGV